MPTAVYVLFFLRVLVMRVGLRVCSSVCALSVPRVDILYDDGPTA